MALQKQAVPINFTKGMDTKTDPNQIPLGSFPSLKNTVFTTTGRLTKRNGFDKITTLPNTTQTVLTTFKDNLIATGSNLYTYNKQTDIWLNQGSIQPVQLETQSIVRNSSSQSSPDMAVTDSGLSCVVYNDSDGLSYYQVVDIMTGQQIVQRTSLPATAKNPRVFILGARFIITFMVLVASTPTFKYIPIAIADPTAINSPVTINSDVNSIDAGYDGQVVSNKLYLAWGASGNVVKLLALTSTLGLTTVTSLVGITADLLSMTVDILNFRIYISYWENIGNNGYAASFTYALSPIMDATQIITAIDIRALTSIVSNGTLYNYYENINNYAFVGGSVSDFVSWISAQPPISGSGTGTVSSTFVLMRSVGLASKAFMEADGTIHLMVAYGGTNQPTYFLIDHSGSTYMRLAYSNGGGYVTSPILPNVQLVNDTYYFPYRITDFLTTVNKGTNLPVGTPVNAIYTQTGVNVAMFQLNSGKQYSSEIANALHLTGGQLWEYDGVKPVEHGFHVWPEDNVVTTSATGGLLATQDYFYSFTYEWTDNQGNLHRSAPSIPVKITTTSATSTNTLYVPTLRITAKDSTNPVRIVGYRWSAAQQVYYQFTSVTSPVLNDVTVDYVTITDTLADASILGNAILYTTGGVIENIAAPASAHSTLFDNRLWLIDAEDRNSLWFSKQVIENVPVEMSDLFTIYVAPTIGSQGSTGPITALASMDDKLIIFKANAIYYVNGNGPDNTGSNNAYSQPVFVTGIAGCTNPKSIVLTAAGIMFQSDKGIWLLGRDLSYKYIGDAVEAYNSNVVVSAQVIPGTTQARFILDNNLTLMYDYYYEQWGIHTNIYAISATLYQGKHTYLNSYGQVLQESLDSYKDGSVPVLISLTTAWINVAGLQGFERFYYMYLLGAYKSPFKLDVQFAYDYNPSPVQNVTVLPEGNPAPDWGDEALWGSGGPWGGSEGNVFQARIFPKQQKCQSFQITINELYDPSYGQVAGEGLSLSGINIIIGTKRGYRTQKAAKSFGRS